MSKQALKFPAPPAVVDPAVEKAVRDTLSSPEVADFNIAVLKKSLGFPSDGNEYFDRAYDLYDKGMSLCLQHEYLADQWHLAPFYILSNIEELEKDTAYAHEPRVRFRFEGKQAVTYKATNGRLLSVNMPKTLSLQLIKERRATPSIVSLDVSLKVAKGLVRPGFLRSLENQGLVFPESYCVEAGQRDLVERAASEAYEGGRPPQKPIQLRLPGIPPSLPDRHQLHTSGKPSIKGTIIDCTA